MKAFLLAHYPYAIAYITLLYSSTLYAQSIWNPSLTPKEISVEYFQPSIKKIFFTDFSGYSVQIAARYPINETKFLVVQIPYLAGKAIYQSYIYSPAFEMQISSVTEKHNTIGNIYIGMESHPEGASHFLNFGVYLPTINRDKPLAVIPSVFGNSDEYESYSRDFLSLNFRLNNNIAVDDKLGFITRVGIAGLIRTREQNSGDGFEAFLGYALQPAITIKKFSALIGFSGKMIVTESGPLKDRVLHLFGVSAAYTIDPLRFGVYYRVPLNNTLSKFMENTIGVTAVFVLL